MKYFFVYCCERLLFNVDQLFIVMLRNSKFSILFLVINGILVPVNVTISNISNFKTRYENSFKTSY